MAQNIINDMNNGIHNLQQMSSKKNDGSEHHNIPDLGLDYELYFDPNDPADIYHGVWFHNYEKLVDTSLAIDDEDPNYRLFTLKPLFGHYGEEVFDMFFIGTRFYMKNNEKTYTLGGLAEGLGTGSSFRAHNLWLQREKEGNTSANLTGTINHEIMHSISGLTHASHTYVDPATNISYTRIIASIFDINKDDEVINSNNILSYNGCSCAMTEAQFIIYRDSLMNAKNKLFLTRPNACITRTNPITIYSGTTVIWDFYQEIDQNVIIEPTATLIITCDQRTNAKFIVQRGGKLIIEGCSISNLCETDYWRGIDVWGNPSKAHPTGNLEFLHLASDDPGVVLLKAATLIKPVNGVYTGNNDLSWDSEYWGGIVQAISSDFLGHRRGVSFMPYRGNNSSYFYDCSFNSYTGYAGITMWDVRKVLIEDCNFEAQNVLVTTKVNGIVGYDATPQIKNCNFFGLGRAVEAHSTLVNIMSPFLITDECNFHGNKYHHIYSNGILGLEVDKNRFDTVTEGSSISILGNAQFNIKNNIFVDYALKGIELKNTGFREKEIFYNYFKSIRNTSVNSLYMSNINYRLQFKSNCFNNPYNDINNQASNLIDHQGSRTFANNNYFNTSNIGKAEYREGAVRLPRILYFLLEPVYNPHPRSIPHCDLPNPCMTSYSNHINDHTSISASVEPPLCIGGGIIGDFIDPAALDPYPSDQNSLLFNYSHYKDSITIQEIQLSNMNPLSQEWSHLNSDLQLNKYYKAVTQGRIMQNYSSTFNYNELRNFINLENIEDKELVKAGVEITSGNYSLAKTMLNAISNLNDQYSKYNDMAQMHLDCLIDPINNHPTSLDSMMLEYIAADTGWVSGYARTLMRLYFDRIIEVVDSLEDRSGIFFTNSKLIGNLTLINNPVGNSLQINANGFEQNINNSYKIFNNEGKEVCEGKLNLIEKIITINVSKLEPGFYLIVISNSNEIVSRGKFIKA